MNYVFTAAEQIQIREAMSACSGLIWRPAIGKYEAIAVAGTSCVTFREFWQMLASVYQN